MNNIRKVFASILAVSTLTACGSSSSGTAAATSAATSASAASTAVAAASGDPIQIAIPDDPTNGGRAIKLLESAGLIEVDPAAGYAP